MKITKKIRNWKMGESTESFIMNREFEMAIAKTITDEAAHKLAEAGETVMTITVEVNIGGTVLAKAQERR